MPSKHGVARSSRAGRANRIFKMKIKIEIEFDTEKFQDNEIVEKLMEVVDTLNEKVNFSTPNKIPVKHTEKK